METRILHYFLAIAKLGTISAAARELHVAQPTLSRQLQQLEGQLGAPLFIRERRRMVLTKAGLAYQRRIQQILTELDRANQVVADLNNDELTGTVGIGCVESAVTKFLIPLLRKFHQQYSQVELSIYDGDGELIKDQLDRGAIEVGLVSTPINAAKYHYLQLPVTDRWGVAVNQSSPFRNQKSININELRGQKLIIPHRSLVHDEVSDWLKASNQEVSIVAEYNLLTNAAYLTATGMGNLICIQGAPLPAKAHLTFIPLTPKHQQEHYLIWRKGASLGEPAQRLIKYFRTQLASQPR